MLLSNPSMQALTGLQMDRLKPNPIVKDDANE
jgi:hypothetical protein